MVATSAGRVTDTAGDHSRLADEGTADLRAQEPCSCQADSTARPLAGPRWRDWPPPINRLQAATPGCHWPHPADSGQTRLPVTIPRSQPVWQCHEHESNLRSMLAGWLRQNEIASSSPRSLVPPAAMPAPIPSLRRNCRTRSRNWPRLRTGGPTCWPNTRDWRSAAMRATWTNPITCEPPSCASMPEPIPASSHAGSRKDAAALPRQQPNATGD